MQKVTMKTKAKKAWRKPSLYGPDIDLSVYTDQAEEQMPVKDLRELPGQISEESREAGITLESGCRSGSFFQIDHSVVLASSYESGLEVMNISDALQEYDWLSAFLWKAVSVDSDKYTAQSELNRHNGYFLRALPGHKVVFPLQACLFMKQEGLAQNVHNIIIAEEGSEMHIITGCATALSVQEGLHIGISEFYIKKNARITFTMIHNWSEKIVVRPRSAAIVYDNGVFLSNYICMKPVKSLQMYPTAYCAGADSTVRFNSIVSAEKGSDIDIGSRVFLKAAGSRAEVIARAVSTGGTVKARGHLIGEVAGIKAHLECRGLLLSDEGIIHAIPELEGRADNIDMSHEAAVGRINEEEIQYLMARGLRDDEAKAAVVRGFLDVEIKGLPEQLQKEIKNALKIKEKGDYLL
jgi:Fe-S cluster assembly scaffold protein SufB